jgi:hypothetical protein
MKLRSVALALALSFGLTGLAEAKKKPVYTRQKISKLKVHKYNVKKANKAAAKQLAKQRRKRPA